MKNQQGVILLVVLLFLQVFVILGLYALQMTLVETKQAQAIWEHQVVLNDAENVLRQIEKSLSKGLPSCLIKMAPQKLIEQPISGWESSEACSAKVGLMTYHYVIEDLGSDSCGIILTSPGFVGHYFRITLFALRAHVKTVLKSTFVMKELGRSELLCSEPQIMHTAVLGRQMSYRVLS